MFEEFDRPSKVVCVEKNYYTITIEGLWKPGSFLRVNFKGAEARKSVVLRRMNAISKVGFEPRKSQLSVDKILF